jgi:F-box/TPR repeat protein Pof3
VFQSHGRDYSSLLSNFGLRLIRVLRERQLVCNSLFTPTSRLSQLCQPSSLTSPAGQQALKVYLRRSNYTLESATVHSRAQFDDKKWAYLTKTCKNLSRLKINGAGVIGNSLTNALPITSSLTSITVSANCEISQFAVAKVFHCCQKTLVDATFLAVVGSRTNGHWPTLPALQSLDLRARKGMPVPMVSLTYCWK